MLIPSLSQSEASAAVYPAINGSCETSVYILTYLSG